MAGETTLEKPLTIKTGKNAGRIRDPNVAHAVGIKINSKVDDIFRNRKIDPDLHQRDEYATSYHNQQVTEQTLEQARDNIRLENEISVDQMTGLFSDRRFRKDGVLLLSEAIRFNSKTGIEVNYKHLRNFNVTRSDIGFLGYANTLPGGHDKSGDPYKISLAQIVGGLTDYFRKYKEKNNIQISGYTLTKGDEFGQIVIGSPEQVEDLTEEIRNLVSSMQIGPGAVLPASLSIASVNAAEYFDRFLSFQNSIRGVDANLQLRFLLTLSSLADFKAEIQKINERLFLLRDFDIRVSKGQIKRDIFNSFKPHILKGAAEISEGELFVMMFKDRMGKSLLPDEEFRKKAMLWIKTTLGLRLKNSIRNAQSEGKAPNDVFEMQLKAEILKNM